MYLYRLHYGIRWMGETGDKDQGVCILYWGIRILNWKNGEISFNVLIHMKNIFDSLIND